MKFDTSPKMVFTYSTESTFDCLEFLDVPIYMSFQNELDLVRNLTLGPEEQIFYEIMLSSKVGVSLTLRERVHLYRHLLFQSLDKLSPCFNSEACLIMWRKLGIHLRGPAVM